MSQIIQQESTKVTAVELKQIMGTSQVPSVEYNLILNHIALGGKAAAKNTDLLSKLGVTHIINTAYDHTGKGNFIYVDVNEDYYKKRNFDCKYMGIRAIDTPRFKLNRFFEQAVEFIEDAKNVNGVVYIHCVMGMSRSATIVIIYLMIKHKMTAKEAAQFVRTKREIFPNDGFLDQIVELEHNLLGLNNSSTEEENSEISGNSENLENLEEIVCCAFTQNSSTEEENSGNSEKLEISENSEEIVTETICCAFTQCEIADSAESEMTITDITDSEIVTDS